MFDHGRRRRAQDYEEKGTQASSGPHFDYMRNVLHAEQGIMSIQKHLKPGMKLYIGDSHGCKRAILMVCLTPGPGEAGEAYATPISLNQSHAEYIRESESAIYGIFKIYEAREDKSPKIKIVPKTATPATQVSFEDLHQAYLMAEICPKTEMVDPW